MRTAVAFRPRRHLGQVKRVGSAHCCEELLSPFLAPSSCAPASTADCLPTQSDAGHWLLSASGFVSAAVVRMTDEVCPGGPVLLLLLPPCAWSNCACSTSIHSEIDLRKATRIFRVAFGGRLSAMGNQAVDRTTVIAVKPGIHHSLAVTRADAARHVPWRQASSREGRPSASGLQLRAPPNPVFIDPICGSTLPRARARPQ